VSLTLKKKTSEEGTNGTLFLLHASLGLWVVSKNLQKKLQKSKDLSSYDENPNTTPLHPTENPSAFRLQQYKRYTAGMLL
jgi:hypothetical protein